MSRKLAHTPSKRKLTLGGIKGKAVGYRRKSLSIRSSSLSSFDGGTHVQGSKDEPNQGKRGSVVTYPTSASRREEAKTVKKGKGRDCGHETRASRQRLIHSNSASSELPICLPGWVRVKLWFTLPAAMSAVVCGKRSLFDEIHGSPPIPKRVRCGSGGSSPIHFLSWRSGALLGTSETLSPAQTSVDLLNLLSQLQALFPDMDGELLENALELSGNNLDSAIKSLNELCLTSDQRNLLNRTAEGNATINCQSGDLLEGESPAAPAEAGENPDPKATLLCHNTEWVDVFVQEMLSASNLDDARDRAARALQAFEKTVMATAGSMFEEMQKDNGLLKEQLGVLLRDNQILKRAVTIQHDRQVEHESCAKEIQELKQMITQYQEQIRNLELSNYALNLHLRKAQEGTSMPGHFHPDVF